MAYQKTEGGQGGKKGHSNMAHWDYTEVIKKTCKKVRRSVSKMIINDELKNQ